MPPVSLQHRQPSSLLRLVLRLMLTSLQEPLLRLDFRLGKKTLACSLESSWRGDKKYRYKSFKEYQLEVLHRHR